MISPQLKNQGNIVLILNGVQIWLDICKKAPRGSGLFKVNGSLPADPLKLMQAKAQTDTMMQQFVKFI